MWGAWYLVLNYLTPCVQVWGAWYLMLNYLTPCVQVWGAGYLVLNYLTASLGLGLGVGLAMDYYVPDTLQVHLCRIHKNKSHLSELLSRSAPLTNKFTYKKRSRTIGM